MKLFRYIKNLFLLWHYSRVIKRIRGKRLIKVKELFKLKLQFIKIKINRRLISLVIAAQGSTKNIIHLKLLWVNWPNYMMNEESSMYQTLYEIFLQLSPEVTKVTIVLDITDKEQVERLRRIFTIHGFEPDSELTLKDLVFQRPWRAEETLNNIVYSRTLSV